MAGASFGDLVIDLRADSTQFAADLKKSQRSLGGFVSGVTTGFAKIGLAADGLRTVVNALIGPMQEAQEAALAERKLAQVFKSTASAAGVAKDEVMAYAAERQKMTSFDADDTVNAAAILGSFTNIKGNMFTDALTSAQDLSAFMGQDLQSSVIQLGKALNDPARGVSALAKSGVQFSEAQKKQIKSLQETGHLAEAQAIILKELQTQFGGQAEALVDPIQQAKHAWGDFMEEIGGIANEKLLPLMPKLIESFEQMADAATGAFETISPVLEKIVEANSAMKELSEHGGGFLPKNIIEATSPAAWAMGGMGKDKQSSGSKTNLFRGLMNPMDLIDSKRGQSGMGFASSIRKAAPAVPDESIAKAAAQAMSKSIVSELDGLLAAEPRMVFDEQKKSASIKNQGGQFMAGLIRDGLAGLESGFMSLGKAPGEAGQMNQIGSLEKGSQEAFDVLRANTSGGDKDVAQKQLKAAEKSNENLAKILKVLNDPKSTRNEVKIALRGID